MTTKLQKLLHNILKKLKLFHEEKTYQKGREESLSPGYSLCFSDDFYSPRKTFFRAKTAGFGSPLKSTIEVFAVHGKQS